MIINYIKRNFLTFILTILTFGLVVDTYRPKEEKIQDPVVQIFSSERLKEYEHYSRQLFMLQSKDDFESIEIAILFPALDHWFVFDQELKLWSAVSSHYIELLYYKVEITNIASQFEALRSITPLDKSVKTSDSGKKN